MRKKKEKEGILIIRGVPTALRGRVNALAELIDSDRDQMVIGWLEAETEILEALQRELMSRKNSRQRPNRATAS